MRGMSPRRINLEEASTSIRTNGHSEPDPHSAGKAPEHSAFAQLERESSVRDRYPSLATKPRCGLPSQCSTPLYLGSDFLDFRMCLTKG
jgi:hypothetical protein